MSRQWGVKRTALYIGLDIGVNTGIAVWNRPLQKFDIIKTVKIHTAMAMIKEYKDQGMDITVRVEDASQVRFKTDPVKAQGAGSVKRDASIWRDYLEELGIPFEMARPVKAITKLPVEVFQKMTGYTGLTSVHSRDAAMLVYNM